MHNYTRIGVLLAGIALVAGCESVEAKSCTLIGCASGFTVDLQTSAWPSGAWQVKAHIGSETRTCSVTLPLPTNGQAVCSGKMSLGTSGSALAPAQQSLTAVTLPDTPTSVAVEVFRDGVMVAAQPFTPVYTTSQPNGAGCEPTCTQAHAALVW